MARTRTPVGPHKKMLIPFPQEVLDVLEAEAIQQDRSLTGQIVHVLREWCEPKKACPDKAEDSELVATAS